MTDPGTLQAAFCLYPLNNTCSPLFVSSSISWSRWRPYGTQSSTTIQNSLSISIILVFLIICPDKSQYFYSICINLFPVFLCHIPTLCILSLLQVWVFLWVWWVFLAFAFVLSSSTQWMMWLYEEFRIRATSNSWSPLPYYWLWVSYWLNPFSKLIFSDFTVMWKGSMQS